MCTMFRTVAICFCFIWTWKGVSANGEIFERNITLTWNESRKYCEDIGKVLFDVQESNSKHILKNILEDTNQTWVSATLEFSHFVKVPVCMGTRNKLIANTTFDTDLLGNCLEFCDGYLYVGLKDKDCFCFKDAGSLIRSKGCNSMCNNDPIHLCGGNESISLYERVEKNITESISHGYKECVYARNTRQGLILFTGSCVGQVADGAICERANTSSCRNHSWTVTAQTLCRMDPVVPFKWISANQHCAAVGGQLMSSKVSGLNLKLNSTYWYGFYRIPLIHKANVMQLITNDTYCAVARKEGDMVIIEGEDCHAKHAILCQDAILDRSSSSPQSTEKSMSGETSNSESTGGTIIYPVVTVSAMLLVAFAITALVCVFRRKRQLSHQLVEVSKTDSSAEQHTLLERQVTNPPAKPSRKAHLIKENFQSSYENIVFIRREQEVVAQQPAQLNFAEAANYKIDSGKEHIYENNYKDGATHVSDHGSLNMTEDPYDLTFLSGVKTPFLNEIDDGTTLRQTLDTSNVTHGEEGVVDSETRKQIDNDYDTIDGQNQTLSETKVRPKIVEEN